MDQIWPSWVATNRRPEPSSGAAIARALPCTLAMACGSTSTFAATNGPAETVGRGDGDSVWIALTVASEDAVAGGARDGDGDDVVQPAMRAMAIDQAASRGAQDRRVTAALYVRTGLADPERRAGRFGTPAGASLAADGRLRARRSPRGPGRQRSPLSRVRPDTRPLGRAVRAPGRRARSAAAPHRGRGLPRGRGPGADQRRRGGPAGPGGFRRVRRRGRPAPVPRHRGGARRPRDLRAGRVHPSRRPPAGASARSRLRLAASGALGRRRRASRPGAREEL